MSFIQQITRIIPVLLFLTAGSNAYATVILDLGTSGVQNNGTLLGNTSISGDAAVGIGALRTMPAGAPPESTRMSVGGDLTDLDMTGGYTYMAWVKVLTDGFGSIIGLGACCEDGGGGQNTAREGYTLNYQGNGELRFWGGSTDDDNNYNLFTGTGVLGLNAYHHAAVRVALGDVDIFVDGVIVASNTADNLNTSVSLVNQNNINTPGAPGIGGAKVDNGNTVDMLIDEVRVYGSLLSDQDILDIANGLAGPAADRLYYDFEIDGAIPEPATLALLGLGLAGIGFGRRRSKKSI